MIKAAAYLRVSTADQSLENQRPQVEAYAQAHGYTLVEVYAESESGFYQGHQTELARLLADLRKGKRKYDVLLTVALDRLTRGGIGVMWQLVNTFEVRGCRVISLSEPWTASDKLERELMQAVVAYSANYESKRKSQNTKAGQALGRLVLEVGSGLVVVASQNLELGACQVRKYWEVRACGFDSLVNLVDPLSSQEE